MPSDMTEKEKSPMNTTLSTITYPQSIFRRDLDGVTLNPAWIHGNGLYVFCREHATWNLHNFVTNAVCSEPDGSTFAIDESEPNSITGRSPHHEHDGEFWIICMGYAPLALRRVLSRYPRSQNPPPPTDLLVAAVTAAEGVLRQLQIDKSK